MARTSAAVRFASMKRSVTTGERIVRVRAARRTVLLNDEVESRFSDENVLPTLAGFMDEFDLLEPVADFDE